MSLYSICFFEGGIIFTIVHILFAHSQHKHTQAPLLLPHPAGHRKYNFLVSGRQPVTAEGVSNPFSAGRNPHGHAGALVTIHLGVEYQKDGRSNVQTRKNQCEWKPLCSFSTAHGRCISLTCTEWYTNTKQSIINI